MSTIFQVPAVRCAATQRVPAASVALLLSVALAGCGERAAPAKPGQALANVNGEEITVLQLNEEIARAGVPAARQGDVSKQLLQALIDRELLEDAAVKEKLDRDPKVMQAIERARSLIVAQAYMQKRLANVARPTPAEIEEYYKAHPDYFDKRKQFRMEQLVLAAGDLTPEARRAADSARSLEEVAVWLDAQGTKYGRAQVTRSTADLHPELSKKLLAMSKGQLFSVREGDRAMLLSIVEVRDAPVPLKVATPQIAQFLVTRKNKELAAAEVERLRRSAKIEYLNKDLALDTRASPPGAGSPQASGQGQAQAASLDKPAGSPGPSRTGLSQTGLSQTGLSQTGLSQTGMSQTGTSQTGMSRTGTSRTGMSQTGTSRIDSAMAGQGATMPASGVATAPAPEAAAPHTGGADAAALDRGVAGLK